MTWPTACRVSTTYGNSAHNTTTSSANFFVRFFNCSLIPDQFVIRTSAFAIRSQGLVAEVAAVVLARLIFGFLHEARKIAEN